MYIEEKTTVTAVFSCFGEPLFYTFCRKITLSLMTCIAGSAYSY
ncbi:hypothetical protein HMPREF9720_1039 [Alistipes sp. HGB5]|nr:hypothetical protein HMPREF9720_1039 [Alistipes sp. HGB5]